LQKEDSQIFCSDCISEKKQLFIWQQKLTAGAYFSPPAEFQEQNLDSCPWCGKSWGWQKSFHTWNSRDSGTKVRTHGKNGFGVMILSVEFDELKNFSNWHPKSTQVGNMWLHAESSRGKTWMQNQPCENFVRENSFLHVNVVHHIKPQSGLHTTKASRESFLHAAIFCLFTPSLDVSLKSFWVRQIHDPGRSQTFLLEKPKTCSIRIGKLVFVWVKSVKTFKSNEYQFVFWQKFHNWVLRGTSASSSRFCSTFWESWANFENRDLLQFSIDVLCSEKTASFDLISPNTVFEPVGKKSKEIPIRELL